MPRDPHPSALSEIVPVILAGGAGVRLWPLSTRSRPKPFLSLPGRPSFLQQTAARAAAMQAPFIVCNVRHRPLVMAQLPQAGQMILEPEGRGTAPALAAAAHFLARQGDRLLLVMPSDHQIRDMDVFLAAVERGADMARQGWLVTFGMPPRSPSPHYGYICAGESLDGDVFNVTRFAEKPDKAAAAALMEQASCYWNSGIFLMSASSYLAHLKAAQAAIFDQSYQALARARRLQNAIYLDENAFSVCPALSIDYAVMEQSSKSAVIPVSMGWRDLGTWPSLLSALMIPEQNRERKTCRV
ncbi:MAG: mannose-1-phosphate guanylyltransferase [Rhodospirillales bacterium]|nr:mannose-1-phosphate guanylyltransferase [Rhodospirillales bacterium]MCB9994926.1 mannose-1-phosphate guanylyltransferase [Rhodospirillales bacterium]